MMALVDNYEPVPLELARRIGESGLLGDEQLDLLARTFLLADDAVYWQVPDEWFSEEGIIIDLGPLWRGDGCG